MPVYSDISLQGEMRGKKNQLWCVNCYIYTTNSNKCFEKFPIVTIDAKIIKQLVFLKGAWRD